MGTRSVELAVVEDLDVVTDGIRTWVAEDPEQRVALTVVTESIDALLTGEGRHADVVVLDLDLGENEPDDLGVTRQKVTARVSRLSDAGLRVVIFSIYIKPLIVQAALHAGASVFLDKHTGRRGFVDTIVAVAGDEPYMTPPMAGGLLDAVKLSPREEEALRLLFQGMDHASIGQRMLKSTGEPISEKTVKQYIERARAKFAATGRRCRSNTALLARCIEEGRITSAEVADYRSAAER